MEALLVGYVSNATARVTRARHWLERIIEWYKIGERVDRYEIAQWVIHDFGMRASSCGEESEIFGRCHLLVFNGTDTFNAAYQAWRMGAKKETGKSILALAHRIVQGFDTEDMCFDHLSNVSGIGSYVSDCYNYKDAVLKIIELAKKYPEKIFVIRPDSGDHLENIRYTMDMVKQHGMVGKNIRYLDGDSVNPELMKQLIDDCFNNFYHHGCFGTWGIGGNLRNNATRDVLSSSYKICCVGQDYRPVVKLSETIGKLSVPGPNHIARDWVNGHSVEYGHHIKDARKTFYNGVEKDPSQRYTELCYENFSNLQNRCIRQFIEMGRRPADFGKNCSCLSYKIKQIQQQYKEQYR